MIRSDKIISAFFGGVGFRDSTLTDVPDVSTANKETRSGMVFQDGNFLVTIKNIYDCQEDADISDVDFNTLLTNMQNTVILETVNKISEKQSDFIQSANIFPYEKSFKNTITPSSKVVGFEIEKTNDCGIICKLPWVELSFDTAKTFNVYLYNSNKPNAPIQTQSVTTVAGESVIQSLNWYVADDSTYKGGKFYLVYFEDDLDGAKAFKKDFELSSYQVGTSHYNINPVSIGYTGAVIDVSDVTNESDIFGLNLGVDVYNDYTEVFIRNQNLFWTAIKHQMTEKVLNMILQSTRTNFTERETKENQARFALYGNEKYKIEGINLKLGSAIDDIKKMLFYQPTISKGTLR